MATFFGALIALVAAATLSAATPLGFVAFSDGGGNLSISSPPGTAAKTLFTSDGSTTMQSLDVSPNGSQILAIEYGNTAQLALVPVAGGAATIVAGSDGAGSGSFSHDGTKIVFSDFASSTLAGGLYTIPVAGGTPTLLVATPTNTTDSLPEYSPDGSKIAFVRDAYDSQSNETVSLELMPSAGGQPTALATGLAPDLASGGHLSFSPDGKQIAFAGDYSSPGIFTVPVAGGSPTQLTTEYDYWPSFSSDGSKIFFSRDASSANADDNAATPVAPTATDLYELWTMKKDGSAETVLAEGDFENLALAPFATNPAPTATTPASTAPAPTTPPTSTTKTGAGAAASAGAKAHAGSASAITVVSKGSHYVVHWKGKAASWTVKLRVGTRTASEKVKGTVHSHLFVLPGAHGAVTAHVKSP